MTTERKRMNEGISICLPLIWMGLPWRFTSRRTGFSAPALARTHFMSEAKVTPWARVSGVVKVPHGPLFSLDPPCLECPQQ